MNTILDRIRQEPVLVTALVQALLALTVSFGLHLSGEQTAGIMGATAAILAFIARSRVSPVSKYDGPEFDGHGLPKL